MKTELESLLAHKNDVAAHIEFSQKLDRFFHIESVNITSNNLDHYPVLPQDALNTSYSDFYQIFQDLPPNEKIVDLGAGVGRGSLLSCLLGTRNCISIEVVQERVEQLVKALVPFDARDLAIQYDLGGDKIPACENYYLYFAKGPALFNILRELFKTKSKIYVCEAHGDTIPFIELFQNQISLVKQIPLIIPRHHHSINVYQCSGESLIDDMGENFSSWYLLNFDSEKTISVRFKHKGFENEVLMFLPIKFFDLVIYGTKLALQHRESNRRYTLNEEIIVESLIDQNVPSSLWSELAKGSKVLSSGEEVLVEERSGHLIMTKLIYRPLPVPVFS